MKHEIEFYERQYLPLWLRIPMSLFIAAITLLPVFIELANIQVKENTQFWEMLLIVGIPIIVIILFWIIKIDTVIDKNGIYIKMFPFVPKYKFYAWENIAEITIVKNRSFSIGYHLAFKSIEYNLISKKFLKIVLLNKNKIHNSTRQSAEIEEFLENISVLKNGIESK